MQIAVLFLVSQRRISTLKAPRRRHDYLRQRVDRRRSFNTGKDIRADWLTGVGVAINSRLALKSSVRLLFRKLPALEAPELRTPPRVNVGTVGLPRTRWT